MTALDPIRGSTVPTTPDPAADLLLALADMGNRGAVALPDVGDGVARVLLAAWDLADAGLIRRTPDRRLVLTSAGRARVSELRHTKAAR